MLGHVVEASRVGVEQGGHLVDERAGAACAGTVHALFGSRLQICDLGVLTAKFDNDVGLRIFLVDGAGLGDDLLHERHMEIIGQGKAAGTGDGQTNRLVAAATGLKFFVGCPPAGPPRWHARWRGGDGNRRRAPRRAKSV